MSISVYLPDDQGEKLAADPTLFYFIFVLPIAPIFTHSRLYIYQHPCNTTTQHTTQDRTIIRTEQRTINPKTRKLTKKINNATWGINIPVLLRLRKAYA